MPSTSISISRSNVSPTRVNHLPDTAVHPLAFVVPFASTAVFLVACWIGFGAGAYIELAVVTLITVMLFGLLAGGAYFAPDVTPERRHGRSFGEFWHGQVDTFTGMISGREAILQLAVMPVALAIGGSAFVAIAVLR